MTDPAPMETTRLPANDPLDAAPGWEPHEAEGSCSGSLTANASCPADATELCHAIVRAITLSPTSGDALDALFGVLRAGYGALALALEVAAGSATRLQPYGDIRALME